MIVPDVNLLLYAEITAFEHHDAARAWWESVLSEDRPIGITSVALFGFLRIATNRHVFSEPLGIDDAIARAERWLARTHVSVLVPGQDHLGIAFRLLRRLGTGANLTTDVQLAAYAIEHGAELFSNDSDFGRFEGLRWIDPLSKRA